jgi:hypothetical protein
MYNVVSHFEIILLRLYSIYSYFTHFYIICDLQAAPAPSSKKKDEEDDSAPLTANAKAKDQRFKDEKNLKAGARPFNCMDNFTPYIF